MGGLLPLMEEEVERVLLLAATGAMDQWQHGRRAEGRWQERTEGGKKTLLENTHLCQ